MEPGIRKPTKRRRTQSEILVLLNDYENGNTGIADFCITHDICRATFNKWCNRYKNNTVKQNEQNGFATLQITGDHRRGVVTLFAEVKGIKLYQPVTASYLKELALP